MESDRVNDQATTDNRFGIRCPEMLHKVALELLAMWFLHRVRALQ
jgi:hypothetical protein